MRSARVPRRARSSAATASWRPRWRRSATRSPAARASSPSRASRASARPGSPRAVATAAATRGALTAWGRAVEDGGAYGPWTEPLRELVRHAPGLAPDKLALARTLAGGAYDSRAGGAAGGAPAGGAYDSRSAGAGGGDDALAGGEEALAGGAPVSGEDARARVFDAVAALLDAAAAPSGLVLVLDDMHWADRSSLDLLRHVVRRLPPAARVLVVVTYRDAGMPEAHPLAGALDELAHAPGFTRIRLEGLDLDEIRAFVGDDARAARHRRARPARAHGRQPALRRRARARRRRRARRGRDRRPRGRARGRAAPPHPAWR